MALSILQSRAISTRIASNLKVLLEGNISIVQSRKLSKAIMEDIALLGGEDFTDINDDSQSSEKVGLNSFITAPDGSSDFGTMPKLESKFEQGKEYPTCPIRMEEGGAFGRAHIKPERLQAFKDNGYSSEAEMLDDVAKHFTHIYEQPNGRLLLVKRNGRAKFSVVELQKQGKYYGVTTLFLEDAKSKGKPYETRSGRKLLWPIAEATSSGSDAIFPTDSNQTGEKVADADKSKSNKNIPQSSENATLVGESTPIPPTIKPMARRNRHQRMLSI